MPASTNLSKLEYCPELFVIAISDIVLGYEHPRRYLQHYTGHHPVLTIKPYGEGFNPGLKPMRRPRDDPVKPENQQNFNNELHTQNRQGINLNHFKSSLKSMLGTRWTKLWAQMYSFV